MIRKPESREIFIKGGSATVQRGKTKAIRINGDRCREALRQYIAERQSIYRITGIKEGRIGDSTERKGRGYTDQGGTDGGG